MASFKAFSLFSLALLLLLLPLLSAHATNSPNSHDKKSSPFEFLKHLQGCHKGNKTKGIHHLKKYLEQFGYLSYSHSKNHTHANDDDFDELLESAVKTYQLNYHLNASGTLDDKTVSTMMRPRCGVADIINGTNWMRPGKKRHHKSHGSLHTVSHYSFFQGQPKWPPSNSKYHLTYGFVDGTPSEAMNPVAQAFLTWASNTHFTFSQAQGVSNADIKIGFSRGDHGDGHPFDGAGGTLAHAFAPTDGRFHYDGDERWSVGAVSVHLTWRQLPCMKSGTFLDSGIAKLRELSCSLASLQESPKVCMPTIFKELKPYTTFEGLGIRNYPARLHFSHPCHPFADGLRILLLHAPSN